MNSLTKKALAFAFAIMAVAVIGWYGRKTYKTATEHRLLSQAQRYMHDKDPRNAGLCLQRALQLNPMSLDAARLMADLADEAGSPAALSWRIRAAQLNPTHMEYRFEWAKAAFRVQDYRSAAEALDGVDESGKSTAAYHKLEGQLYWNVNKPSEAEKEYTEALRLEPADQMIVLNLATIHVASTNTAIAAAARHSMLEMTTSTNSELRLGALHVLAADADAHKSVSKAIGYSERVVEDSSATFRDRIGHLQLLKEAGRPQFDPWLKKLEQEARLSPAQAFLLGEWMAKMESPAFALKWLQSLPSTVQTNQPVPLIIADCNISLKDWPSLLKLLGTQDWGEMNYYRLALESLGHRSLGHAAASESSWQNAERLSSRHLDRLSRLAQLTAVFHWNKERAEVLDEITTKFPKEKWAVDQLVAQLYEQGDTRAIQDLLTRSQTAYPNDPLIKNNLAIVLLLRNSDLEKARRMAKESYEHAPENPFFASTYAYSLVMQKDSNDAVKAFSSVNPKYLQIPSVAAYYGIVEEKAGHPDIARVALARAETARLLPEEKELVREAKSRL